MQVRPRTVLDNQTPTWPLVSIYRRGPTVGDAPITLRIDITSYEMLAPGSRGNAGPAGSSLSRLLDTFTFTQGFL